MQVEPEETLRKSYRLHSLAASIMLLIQRGRKTAAITSLSCWHSYVLLNFHN